MVILDGESNIQFAPEIDNCIGLQPIQNCMIGPCFDSSCQLRGMVYLYNKKKGLPITQKDEKEFENLLPSVAEILKQVDELELVRDISANINLSLCNAKNQIKNSTKALK